MAAKMANRFRRSLSFPNQHSHSSSEPPKTIHNRSTSLPCRSHPTVSQLGAGIAHIHPWIGSVSASRDSAWLCDGLKRLNAVHDSLVDLLQLPRTRDLLRRGEFSAFIERLLEDFLRFVDVYGRFQTLVLSLKDECSATEMAVRRRDGSDIDSCLKNLNRLGIQIGKLVSDLRYRVGGFSVPASRDDDESELIQTIEDVLQVTSLVSVSLFGGISASFAIRKRSYMGLKSGRWTKNSKIEVGIRKIDMENLWALSKKVKEARTASKKLHELEGCIVEIQGCGEKAFRSLINTRVSLLNLLTL
ncbi:uncharacterized protein [Primulina huaijiensis]|uniref:uncharacterized protein n=1 Tax=Primulina huaijiensis TaxID=1492673 RepID=UPI003CC70117